MIKKIIFINLLLVLFFNNKIESQFAEFKYETILDHDNNVQLKWSILKDFKIRFKLIIIESLNSPDSFLFGLGFSDRGTFINADLCLFEIKNGNLVGVSDSHTNLFGDLYEDYHNDYKLIDFSGKFLLIQQL